MSSAVAFGDPMAVDCGKRATVDSTSIGPHQSIVTPSPYKNQLLPGGTGSTGTSVQSSGDGQAVGSAQPSRGQTAVTVETSCFMESRQGPPPHPHEGGKTVVSKKFHS